MIRTVIVGLLTGVMLTGCASTHTYQDSHAAPTEEQLKTMRPREAMAAILLSPDINDYKIHITEEDRLPYESEGNLGNYLANIGAKELGRLFKQGVIVTTKESIAKLADVYVSPKIISASKNWDRPGDGEFNKYTTLTIDYAVNTKDGKQDIVHMKQTGKFRVPKEVMDKLQKESGSGWVQSQADQAWFRYEAYSQSNSSRVAVTKAYAALTKHLDASPELNQLQPNTSSKATAKEKLNTISLAMQDKDAQKYFRYNSANTFVGMHSEWHKGVEKFRQGVALLGGVNYALKSSAGTLTQTDVMNESINQIIDTPESARARGLGKGVSDGYSALTTASNYLNEESQAKSAKYSNCEQQRAMIEKQATLPKNGEIQCKDAQRIQQAISDMINYDQACNDGANVTSYRMNHDMVSNQASKLCAKK